MGFDMLSAFDGFARGDQTTPETRVVAAGYRLKRTLDILLAGSGLLFLSPALILIVIALLFVDGRPISFSHTRVGRWTTPAGKLPALSCCAIWDKAPPPVP